MEMKYKITVPKPCHENWNAMTPEESGKFCSTCSKSVVDFTNMESTEVQEYFIQNKEQKICGRFKNEQLDSVIIQIPQNILFSQLNVHKMFMLALLISMGTSLLSCQNSNGKKQKIDGVEVIDAAENHTTMGISVRPIEIADSVNTTSKIQKKLKETKIKGYSRNDKLELLVKDTIYQEENITSGIIEPVRIADTIKKRN